MLIYIVPLSLIYSTERGQKIGPSSRSQLTRKLKLKKLGTANPHAGHSYSQNQVMVKFKSNLSDMKVTTTLNAYGTKQLKRIPRLDVFVLQIPDHLTVDETLTMLKLNPDIEYAEPNYKTYTCLTPNDLLFAYQYSLHNTGQSIGVPGSPSGQSRADIRAPEAWEETRGSDGVVVAVIDSGLDFNHPDLANKYSSRGRDLVNDDFDATDDSGHGTYTSGIIAAETNNSEGIAGVAWNCKVLPVKAIDTDGTGLYSWMIDGIIWAADQGVDVISLSIGGDVPADALEAALKYAYDLGVVIVASAGNDTGSVVYPAAYDDYVLACAATDYNDVRPDWSNSGPEIDVAAPGDRVISCYPAWALPQGTLPYIFGFGTSASAPIVAGLAALIKSLKPWLTPLDIMNIIRYTSDDINATEYPGRDDFIGYGRINMEKALVPIKIK